MQGVSLLEEVTHNECDSVQDSATKLSETIHACLERILHFNINKKGQCVYCLLFRY